MSTTRAGADLYPRIAPSVRGARVGVVVNHTSFDRGMRHLSWLAARDAEYLVIFTPEHGLYGDAQAGERVEGGCDPWTGAPVYSLYGAERSPPLDLLRDLDLLVYSIQDLGLRWYTYAATLKEVVAAAAKAGTPLYVLDTPAPLTGRVEGPLLREGYESFIAPAPMPVRYGLTPGELALYYSRVLGLGGEVHVVRMEGWSRGTWFDETGRPWIPPSPAIPSLEAALVYAGTCLFEAANISEGRGTYSPFLQVGAPWLDGRCLADMLRGEVRGAELRPVHFRPLWGKYRGERVSGVYIHVTDRNAYRPFEAAVRMLRAIWAVYGEAEWLPGRGRPLIDMLAGTDKVRRVVEGTLDLGDALERWRREAREWASRIAGSGVLQYG